MMIGELGLDGRLRPVRGVLPAVLAAADAGYRHVVVPERTTAEAALVPGVSVLGVRSLRQLVAVLNDEPVPEEQDDADAEGRPDPMLAGLTVPGSGVGTGLVAGFGGPGAGAGARPGGGHVPDLADVAGQRAARLALEAAAAGGHHLYLKGPPGAGQDDAGRAAARHPAPAHPAGVPGGHRRALGRRHPARGPPPGRHPALLRPAPLRHHARPRRRRQRTAQARRRLPVPSRSALSRRSAGIQRALPGSTAAAPGVRARRRRPGRRGDTAPRPLHAGDGRQPVPVRAVLRARRRLRLLTHRRPPLPGPAVRAAAGPGRPAGRRRRPSAAAT